MSLAERVESARVQTPNPNILTLDIERLPGRAKVQHRGLTVTGDFWDLNSWKHTIGRRIDPDDVVEWPYTICVAWRFYGRKTTHFASVWGDGWEKMHQRVWDAYDRADVLYGHNVDRFDTRHLNTAWRDLRLGPPSPFRVVDTLKEARKRFGDESMKLDALCKRMGIQAKTGRYDVATARAAVAGDRAAQREMKSYNEGDIDASEALADGMRGWLTSHPHVGRHAELKPRCNQCGSADLAPNGVKLAVVLTYSLYRCRNCGANVQGTGYGRVAITRGAV